MLRIGLGLKISAFNNIIGNVVCLILHLAKALGKSIKWCKGSGKQIKWVKWGELHRWHTATGQWSDR